MRRKPGPPKGRSKSDVNRSPLGRRLCRARRARGLTQEELGQRIGVSKRMIAHYEAGSKAMTVPTLQKIASTLGVTVAYLLAERAPTFEESAPMRPSLKKRVEVLQQLPPADQQAIFRMIDNAQGRLSKGTAD